MIKIILDPLNKDPSIDHGTVFVSGDLMEVVAELGFAIADIYNCMKRRDAVMAEVFREMMDAVTRPHSPTWRAKTDTPGSVATILMGDEIRGRKDCGNAENTK